MALTKDDKKYFELVLGPINIELIGISTRLDKINGAVQKHEKEISDIIIEKAVNREHQKIFDTTCEEVEDIKIKLEDIDDSLLEYKFMKKYPKISLIVMSIFGICLIALALGQFNIL